MTSKILREVRDYYTSSFLKHGLSPNGVDWNGRESQFLRFCQLMRIAENDPGPWSINDLGCGYGALVEALCLIPGCSEYSGYDLVPEMIEKGKQLGINRPFPCHFFNSNNLNVSDYTVASGIFNVKCDQPESKWLDYILKTLHEMNTASIKGFAFNMLTVFSDPPYQKPHLYYADPSFIFSYCKRFFSRNVALLHDYELYEFTILVKKSTFNPAV